MCVRGVFSGSSRRFKLQLLFGLQSSSLCVSVLRNRRLFLALFLQPAVPVARRVVDWPGPLRASAAAAAGAEDTAGALALQAVVKGTYLVIQLVGGTGASMLPSSHVLGAKRYYWCLSDMVCGRGLRLLWPFLLCLVGLVACCRICILTFVDLSLFSSR